MTKNTNTRTVDAYSQFEKWLSEQPYWLQDAAFRIYHNMEIDETQISAYADMCILQAKKIKPVYKHLSKNESKIQTVAARMSVLRLSDIVGVNALSSDASLDFLPEGITVVYGLNGAGKSGFMRIFKQLSGSPFEEVIQPNVYLKGAMVKPSCKFIITEDDQESKICCNLISNSKDSPLVNCDVFDTRISNDYITKSNNVSYQPPIFSVLTKLATIAGEIRKHIDRRIDSIPTTSIVIPKELLERDEIRWIQNLNKVTEFPSQYACWTEAQQKRLDEIQKSLDSENVTNNLRLCESHLSTISPILDDLTATNHALNSSGLNTAYKALIEAKRKLENAKMIFAETADDYDKVSVSVADWKELWRIALRYYDSTIYKDGEGYFGEEGSICPLCHQIISGSTSTRFKSVNEYVNGTCSDDYNKAAKDLRKLISAVITRVYSANQIKGLLANIFDDVEISKIEGAYLAIGEKESFGDLEIEYDRVSKIFITEAIGILSAKKTTLEKQKKSLEQSLKDEERVSLQKQFADLTCHKWIYDNKASIEIAIADLRKRQELVNARQFLKTNKITNESNRLANELITDAYLERFSHELNCLAPQIKVKLEKAPSIKGSTPYRVTIDTESGINCRPEDILSEGEQRIVALAAFFADATGREAQTPLIIDDPISSLDMNYESTATQRIVELALNRQVIVFTHRISMLTGISETSQRLGVQHKENYIRSTRKGKGVPDLAEIYRGSVKSHLRNIQARLKEIKRLDPDSSLYNDAVGRQCQQFRICIERSVEDVLLLGMVHRFERRIMTNGKVMKLTMITENDCKLVDDMMTKYSFTEHSQPIDSPPVDIDIDELNNDITAFIQWISDYQNRQKSILRST